MKIKLLGLLFVASVFGTAMMNKMPNPHLSQIKDVKFSSGPPAGRTGAPGEGNCTSCHSGSVLSGTGINELVLVDGIDTVNTYLPSTTYTVRTNMNLPSVKKGFQATVFNSSNAFVGNFTALSNTSVVGGTKKYASHNGGSTAGSTAFWEWTWTAPATNVGPVTFYMSANNANNNGSDSGDQIYLSQFVYNTTAGIDESQQNNFTLYKDKSGDLLFNFENEDNEHIEFVILDLHGKSLPNEVQFNSSNNKISGKIIPRSGFTSGMYVVHCIIGNNAYSKKINL